MRDNSRILTWVFIFAALASAAAVIIAALISSSGSQAPLPASVKVYANEGWQDTGIEVGKGDTVTIQYASGEWSPFPGYYTDGQGCTDSRVCIQDLAILENWPDNIVGGIHATLIARVGSDQIVVVGNDATFRADELGRLQLRMNDQVISDNSGSITVLVNVR